MSQDPTHTFLKDLDAKLWAAADKLRNNLDAAQYKHAVLGLIFLKYVSDAFDARRAELTKQIKDPNSELYYEDATDEEIEAELEDRDQYLSTNTFWVPPLARWQNIQDWAKLPPQTKVEVRHGQNSEYTIKSTALLIDDALAAIEKENDALKNVLDKGAYARLQLDQDNLRGLIDHIASIPFEHGILKSKDILGHVYEYFLGQFALAEGKKGGQYFTPKSIVGLIVEMLQPYWGRVYDPACGSGGFFVEIEKHAQEAYRESTHGTQGAISVYGQESNPTTWRLAAMNMAIRGIDYNFGKEWANSFTNDQHPDLRADFVMANPPFNVSDWWDAKLQDDPRWVHGTPPQGNANFAWVQHMLHHLAPTGSMALLLANGSMSGTSGGEGDIRKALVEADLVECMVALPGQLFTNTQIPACIWFLTKDKSAKQAGGKTIKRDRRGEVLFIDARDLGYMKDRVLRDFTQQDIAKLTHTYHAWQTGPILDAEADAPSARHSRAGGNPEGHKADKTLAKQSEPTTNTQPLDPRLHGDDETNKPSPTAHPRAAGNPDTASTDTPAAADTPASASADNPASPRHSRGGGNPESPNPTQTQGYKNIPGFCFSASLADIREHGHVLTPGRYVGAAEQADDGEPFEDKMQRLTAELREQFAESAALEARIRKNLEEVGYGV